MKSNLGHSEGAASLVSIAKALISLDSGIIPPNKNFRKLNENIEKLKSNEMKVMLCFVFGFLLKITLFVFF